MASTLLSSSITVPSQIQHSSLRRPFFPKTPPPSLSVSCSSSSSSSGANPKPKTPKFARREMLLGVAGGLYAANNNNSPPPATAEPIPPPAMDQCTRAMDVVNRIPIEFNCCPPMDPAVKPYRFEFPHDEECRVRPALHTADRRYMKKFEAAIEAMKDLSYENPNDPRGFIQQSNVHCAYCNEAYPQYPGARDKLQIHQSWFFLPWHRWYLYFYERILGKLIGDPTFALPFWNWDHPDGMTIPRIFTNEDSPLFNPNRYTPHYPPATVDLQFNGDTSSNPRETIVRNNLMEMYNEIVQNGKTLESFYGGKYVRGTPAMDPDFGPGSIEKGTHTAVHRFVGTKTDRGFDMGNFATAGRDLLFFCHHVNIDRLWNVWLDMREEQNKPAAFDDPDWLNTEFNFYNEDAELVTVTVGDSLDPEKLGFTWEDVENQWLGRKPRPLKKKSRFATTAEAPRPQDIGFPVKLDRDLRVLLDRPRRERSGEEKEREEEVLVIQGIDVDSTQFVRFEVFVNDEDVEPDELISTAEYVGSYAQVPMTKHGHTKSKMVLDLSELLEALDIEGDDKILVSVVPRHGGEYVTIDGINIDFVPL